MKRISQSDLVLKTYREITNQLDKPYYVLEGIPTNEGNNHILYSSPKLKEVIGLSQYDLSSDSNQFFNSIHPDCIDSYVESNKRLLNGGEKERRVYLVKNKETGVFVPIEELASSRLNKDRNCFEIYCSIRSIDESIGVNDEADIEMISKAFINLRKFTPENRAKIIETTNHFVDTMALHFKMNACRFYSFNESKKELSILADNQNKRSKHLMESTTRLKTRAVIPAYSETSYFFNLFLQRENHILDRKADILEVLKCHTESNVIKKLAGTAIRFYKLKSFGVLPIFCPNGTIIGLVTFGSSQLYTEEEKKEIYDFTTTNSFVFACLLSAMCQ